MFAPSTRPLEWLVVRLKMLLFPVDTDGRGLIPSTLWHGTQVYETIIQLFDNMIPNPRLAQ